MKTPTEYHDPNSYFSSNHSIFFIQEIQSGTLPKNSKTTPI
jgi:hypothetical protein